MKILSIILLMNFAVVITVDAAIHTTADAARTLRGALASLEVRDAATDEPTQVSTGVLKAIVDLKAFTRKKYATIEEQELARDFTKTAMEFLREGSDGKKKEAIRLLHKAAEFGHGEACGTMIAYCLDGKYGLRPEWADMYKNQVKYWVVPDEPYADVADTALPASAGSRLDALHELSPSAAAAGGGSSVRDLLMRTPLRGDQYDLPIMAAETTMHVVLTPLLAAPLLAGLRTVVKWYGEGDASSQSEGLRHRHPSKLTDGVSGGATASRTGPPAGGAGAS